MYLSFNSVPSSSQSFIFIPFRKKISINSCISRKENKKLFENQHESGCKHSFPEGIQFESTRLMLPLINPNVIEQKLITNICNDKKLNYVPYLVIWTRLCTKERLHKLLEEQVMSQSFSLEAVSRPLVTTEVL